MDVANKTLQLKMDFDDVYNKALSDGRSEGYAVGYHDGKTEGYNEGYSESESDFWNKLQNNGERTNCEYMFYRWCHEYIRPKYKQKTTSRLINMFAYNPNLKKVEKEFFDLSGFTPNINGNVTDNNYNIFTTCSNLEVIEDIGIKGGGYYRTYADCIKLHTIEIMRCVKNGAYSSPFANCKGLINLTIEGEIGTNFDIHYSPLSTASIVNIIEHLSNTSGATLTLNTIAKNNMVFPYTSPYTNVTYNSWDELIATKANWTIATSS